MRIKQENNPGIYCEIQVRIRFICFVIVKPNYLPECYSVPVIY